MIVHLLTDTGRRACRVPSADAPHVFADGECPHCGKALCVRGNGMRPSADDQAHEADALCVHCLHEHGDPARARVGTLRVEADTIFGVREDRAVTEGRARVYR